MSTSLSAADFIFTMRIVAFISCFLGTGSNLLVLFLSQRQFKKDTKAFVILMQIHAMTNALNSFTGWIVTNRYCCHILYYSSFQTCSFGEHSAVYQLRSGFFLWREVLCAGGLYPNSASTARSTHDCHNDGCSMSHFVQYPFQKVDDGLNRDHAVRNHSSSFCELSFVYIKFLFQYGMATGYVEFSAVSASIPDYLRNETTGIASYGVTWTPLMVTLMSNV